MEPRARAVEVAIAWAEKPLGARELGATVVAAEEPSRLHLSRVHGDDVREPVTGVKTADPRRGAKDREKSTQAGDEQE